MNEVHRSFLDFHNKLERDVLLIDGVCDGLNDACKRISRWLQNLEIDEARRKEAIKLEEETILNREFDEVDALIEKAKEVFSLKDEDDKIANKTSQIDKQKSTEALKLAKDGKKSKVDTIKPPSSKLPNKNVHKYSHNKTIQGKPTSGKLVNQKHSTVITKDTSKKPAISASKNAIKASAPCNLGSTKRKPSTEKCENAVESPVKDDQVHTSPVKEIFSEKFLQVYKKHSKLRKKIKKLENDNQLQAEVQFYKNTFMNSLYGNTVTDGNTQSAFSEEQSDFTEKWEEKAPEIIFQKILDEHATSYINLLRDLKHVTTNMLENKNETLSLEDVRKMYVLMSHETLPVFVKTD